MLTYSFVGSEIRLYSKQRRDAGDRGATSLMNCVDAAGRQREHEKMDRKNNGQILGRF